MQNSEIININNILVQLEKINIEERILLTYPNVELSSISLGNLNVQEFQRYFRESIEKIQSISITEIFKLIPNTYGNINFYSELSNMNSYCNSNNFSYANSCLEKIIQYLILFNLWKVSYKVPTGIKISELEKKTVLFSEEVKKLNIESKNTNEIIKSNFEEIENQKVDLQNKIKDINLTKEKIEENYNDIKNILNDVNVLKEKVVGAVDRGNEYLSEINEFHNSAKVLWQKFDDNNIEHLKSIKEVNKKIEFLEEQNQKFIDQNAYLDTLIHKTVGAKLFMAFKHRKDELKWTIWIWAIISLICGIISFYLLNSLFKSLEMNDKIEVSAIFLLLNSIKTFPFLILLFFSINQYSKERKIQEEYAFKSAVALSLNDYAKRVKDENKDEFIITSVRNIYQSPIEGANKAEISTNKVLRLINSISKVLNKNGVKITFGEEDKNN